MKTRRSGEETHATFLSEKGFIKKKLHRVMSKNYEKVLIRIY